MRRRPRLSTGGMGQRRTMGKRTDTSGEYNPGPLAQGRGNAFTAAWTRVVAAGRDGLRDTITGLVAAVVLIANIDLVRRPHVFGQLERRGKIRRCDAILDSICMTPMPRFEI